MVFLCLLKFDLVFKLVGLEVLLGEKSFELPELYLGELEQFTIIKKQIKYGNFIKLLDL
tara:strand:+ start:5007 stop:5183 length:177 start_codon:yes stop_codon:yes gene_type:complete